MQEVVPNLNKKIRRVSDFPKKGIIFWDMTPLFRDSDSFKDMINAFVKRYKRKEVDCIASIEARGFMIGSVVAYLLGVGFVWIRKKGKLPHDTICESYEKEYGRDSIEVHKDTIREGEKVVVIDDLLATGDTSLATCKLVERLGAKVVECAFIVEFTEFGAQKKLKDYKIFSLIKCKETE